MLKSSIFNAAFLQKLSLAHQSGSTMEDDELAKTFSEMNMDFAYLSNDSNRYKQLYRDSCYESQLRQSTRSAALNQHWDVASHKNLQSRNYVDEALDFIPNTKILNSASKNIIHMSKAPSANRSSKDAVNKHKKENISKKFTGQNHDQKHSDLPGVFLRRPVSSPGSCDSERDFDYAFCKRGRNSQTFDDQDGPNVPVGHVKNLKERLAAIVGTVPILNTSQSNDLIQNSAILGAGKLFGKNLTSSSAVYSQGISSHSTPPELIRSMHNEEVCVDRHSIHGNPINSPPVISQVLPSPTTSGSQSLLSYSNRQMDNEISSHNASTFNKKAESYGTQQLTSVSYQVINNDCSQKTSNVPTPPPPFPEITTNSQISLPFTKSEVKALKNSQPSLSSSVNGWNKFTLDSHEIISQSNSLNNLYQCPPVPEHRYSSLSRKLPEPPKDITPILQYTRDSANESCLIDDQKLHTMNISSQNEILDKVCHFFV